MKGATGTQASFLNLFEGDEAKVNRLEQLVAEKVGMRAAIPVSGQTYSRKVDAQVVGALAGFAQSASKFGYDMRLLQHLREIEEPFEEEQVGSSAMAYKRNPMRAERIDALARHLIVNTLNPAMTAATQWFERTLDDSANRRIAIPEAFLAADAIALIYDNIVAGIVVHEEVIAANVRRELPFMMTENLMMEGVRRGGDRQVLHERVRIHSQAAADALKGGARTNDLFDRIAADALFGIDRAVDRRDGAAGGLHRTSRQQTERFLIEDVDPILEARACADSRGGGGGAGMKRSSSRVIAAARAVLSFASCGCATTHDAAPQTAAPQNRRTAWRAGTDRSSPGARRRTARSSIRCCSRRRIARCRSARSLDVQQPEDGSERAGARSTIAGRTSAIA